MTQRAGAGFGGEVSKGPDKETLYSHSFKSLIPGDVAIGVEKALQELGWKYAEATTLRKNPTSPQSAPEEVPFIRHMTDEGIEVPHGSYEVQGFGTLTTNVTGSNIPTLILTAVLLPEKKAEWRELIRRIVKASKEHSIFRGKAVRVETAEDLLVPKSLNLDKDVELVFDPEIENTISTCILWPLLNRDKCLASGVRTKRGAILEGRYGTGKSLLLYKAAQAAQRAGWGVLYLDPGMIGAALAIAPMLEPVVLIVEDADSGAHGSRDKLNGVLNALSSAATKSRGDYMLLLSTNFISRIDPAMLRPERIDAVIQVPLPNHDTIKRLITLFSGDRLKVTDLDAVATDLEGCTPAIIAEAVQRSIIDGLKEGNGEVTDAAIRFHASNMALQKKLAVPDFRTNTIGDRLAETLYNVTQGEGL